MSERKRRFLLAGIAAAGLVLVLLLARRRGQVDAQLVPTSPGAGDLEGGGEFVGAGVLGLLERALDALTVKDAIADEGEVQPPAVTAPATPAPPAPPPSTPSQPSQPNPDVQSTYVEGSKPPSSTWREPWVQIDSNGNAVAIVHPGKGKVLMPDEI